MKTFALISLILLGGVSISFAQNQTVNGTLTVQQGVFLNSNATISGNVNLGSSSSNIINFNGIAGTGLNMANQSITNAQAINLGAPTGGPYTPVSGLINLYSSSNANHAIIFASAQGGNYVYQIPNAGANANFVMTQGTQTINANLGGKTFSSTTNSSAPLVVSNTSGGGANPAISVTSGLVNIAGLTASQPVFTDANDNLTNTGSIPGSDIPVDGSTIVVNNNGQLTAIGAAPSGAASGDLANNYPAPTIAANQSASTDIAASLNANAPTAPINATAGGTGIATYNKGDIVYAASANPTALTNLAVGSASQVLGVTAGGVPGWVTNGATITNTTSTASVSTDQNPFAPSAANSTYIRVSNTSAGTININSINLTGVADGRTVTIVNVSAASNEYIMINSETGPAPSSEQFNLPMQQPIILGQQGAATFIYDLTASYWELVSTN